MPNLIDYVPISNRLGTVLVPQVNDAAVRAPAEAFLEGRAQATRADLARQREERLSAHADRSFQLQERRQDQAFLETLVTDVLEQNPQLAVQIINGDRPEARRVREQLGFPAGVDLVAEDDEAFTFRSRSSGKEVAIRRPSKTLAERKAALVAGLPEAEQRQALGVETNAERLAFTEAEAAARARGKASGTPAGRGGAADKPFTLTPGSVRFDAEGNPIAAVPAAPRRGGTGGGGGRGGADYTTPERQRGDALRKFREAPTSLSFTDQEVLLGMAGGPGERIRKAWQQAATELAREQGASGEQALTRANEALQALRDVDDGYASPEDPQVKQAREIETRALRILEFEQEQFRRIRQRAARERPRALSSFERGLAEATPASREELGGARVPISAEQTQYLLDQGLSMDEIVADGLVPTP